MDAFEKFSCNQYWQWPQAVGSNGLTWKGYGKPKWISKTNATYITLPESIHHTLQTERKMNTVYDRIIYFPSKLHN